MTLRDLFTDRNTWAKYGDMDVYSDYVDDMSAAWCGTLLTFEGAEHYDAEYKYSQYGKILDTPIEIEAGQDCFNITVKTDDYPDFGKRWRYIDQMFYDAAGYCSCTDWDKYWFDDYEPDSLEPESKGLKFDVVFSEEALNTVISALRLETERYWGKDEETVRLLKEAEEQVRNAIRR